jgi:uncharacterized protein DUF2188
MVWRIRNFPSEMRLLPPRVRAKAISIADMLLDERYHADQAVTIAIAQAQDWANRPDSHFDENTVNYHVMPHPQGWVIRASNGTKPCLSFATQADATQAAQELFKDRKCDIIIHKEDGKILRRISPVYH